MRKTTVNTTKTIAEQRREEAEKAFLARSAAYREAQKAKVCYASVAGLVVYGKSTRN